jgi:hypothetical protein
MLCSAWAGQQVPAMIAAGGSQASATMQAIAKVVRPTPRP